MSKAINFDEGFQALTGFPPFPWQRRLFNKYFSNGLLPAGVDIPTGLGKTAVMAIWLLARARQGTGSKIEGYEQDNPRSLSLPRRLVYVVDRRVVVDQATSIAEEIRFKLDSCPELESVRLGLGLGTDQKLPISTLRGRHTDNRKWMEDPSATAIIVGTVDMVGSRLLFEGYGVSRKMRPFAAGLLGCDTLVILDEAHLVRPFEKLLKDIEEGSNDATFGPQAATDRDIVPPFRMLPLSATIQENDESENVAVFRLMPEDRDDKVIMGRLCASKKLAIVEIEEPKSETKAIKTKNFVSELAKRAWRLGSESGSRRVLVYCNRREDALQVKVEIDKRLKKHGGDSELLVGARRIYEREKLAGWLKDKGYLGDSNGTLEYSRFLIATSAGEVGVDLDADDMVCDLVEWERMVQRLGRVNRRGSGQSKIQVVAAPGSIKESDWKDRLRRLRAPLDALRSSIGSEDIKDASLDAILELKLRAANAELLEGAIREATTPAPLRPAITRPLIDAWAMTSLADHSGRPEIDPWLRGWEKDDQPQTSVTWRLFLPLWFKGNSVQLLGEKDVTDFFEAAPLHSVEALETETFRVADWLQKRARQIDVSVKDDSGDQSDDIFSFANRVHKNSPVALVLGNEAQYLGQLSIYEIVSLKRNELERKIGNRKLVLDACVGGLRNGLLDANCNDVVNTPENNWGCPDAPDKLNHTAVREPDLPEQRVRVVRSSVRNEERKGSSQWQEVAAYSRQVNSDGETELWLVVEKWSEGKSNEEGRSIAKTNQSLAEHQDWTAKEAERLANKLGLPPEYREVLISAARHHDEGKASLRWQRAFNAPKDRPYAKTIGPFNRHVLNGYRHELQSVIDIQKQSLEGFDNSDSRYDLILHLIGSHHGNARPHISIEGFDSLPPTDVARYAFDVATRFARLQRRWGPWGLAWWEALLRSADQSASRMLDQVCRPNFGSQTKTSSS